MDYLGIDMDSLGICRESLGLGVLQHALQDSCLKCVAAAFHALRARCALQVRCGVAATRSPALQQLTGLAEKKARKEN